MVNFFRYIQGGRGNQLWRVTGAKVKGIFQAIGAAHVSRRVSRILFIHHSATHVRDTRASPITVLMSPWELTFTWQERKIFHGNWNRKYTRALWPSITGRILSKSSSNGINILCVQQRLRECSWKGDECENRAVKYKVYPRRLCIRNGSDQAAPIRK